ncbi:MAG: UDP-N-acetylmuramate dehydrogenase [Chlorobiaceae bacterium]|jgi:UDP-N-acetylmuramate dehydrogenase|nr:UDP-N-acetylmuramate dehydrogenase [Chlorobiaceae bacterium]
MQESPFPCPFEADAPLSEKSYYRIGGPARFFALPETIRHIGDLLLWNREQRLPLAVMGSGSNMLFSDEPFPGIVLSMERMNRMFWISRDELFCEAGAENTAIAAELLDRGRSGGEWLHMLPGRIGSTVRMNARCFGGEISGVTSAVVTVDRLGRVQWRPAEGVFLGYKETSLMQNRQIVVAAVLRFAGTKPAGEIRAEMDRYEAERRSRHHFDFPSCGSTFRNNYDAGRPSGRIFEELGFKGAREGGAAVSDHHANFIFNTGGASSSDVLALAAKMRKDAREKAGVPLELEVECSGLFRRTELEACGVHSRPAAGMDGKAWAGLLWQPGEDPAEGGVVECFPETLLQGCLTGYSGTDLAFPPGIGIHVEQLVCLRDARLNPSQPFLKWTTGAESGALWQGIPDGGISVPGSFADELWKNPVSELFIGQGESGRGYLEFEMQPSGNWLALRFSDRRVRAAVSGRLSGEPWTGDVERFVLPGAFGMTFSFRLVEPFLQRDTLSLQCCAAPGEARYGLFPWWNAAGEKPDFHQPDRFYRIRLR